MAIRVVPYDGWDELDWPQKAFEARYRVKALAKALGENKLWRFRRKFFRYHDRLPKEQLMLWRAARADALNECGVSIGEISRELGYTDRSHFGRDFKKRHGTNALRARPGANWRVRITAPRARILPRPKAGPLRETPTEPYVVSAN